MYSVFNLVNFVHLKHDIQNEYVTPLQNVLLQHLFKEFVIPVIVDVLTYLHFLVCLGNCTNHFKEVMFNKFLYVVGQFANKIL